MEFKVIVYIVMGIAYFAYSAYKKVNEQQQSNKKAAPKPTASPAQPKPKSWLDETIEKMQQEAEKAKQQTAHPAKTAKPKPIAKPQKRDVIVREVQHTSPFEEGEFAGATYERPLTSEEILHNERMRAAQSVTIEAEEDPQSIAINPREAFIGSIIFERRY